MWLAAHDHCSDCGPSGVTGHTGTDGSSPFDRMDRYGIWLGTAGENIAYGSNDPTEIVMQLFIDDGVPNRGHREAILSRDYEVTAISTCCHSGYDYQTVITYAGGFDNNNLDQYLDQDFSVCCTGNCETEVEQDGGRDSEGRDDQQEDEEWVYGCTDKNTTNYNQDAN
jgi:hypothetical protein